MKAYVMKDVASFGKEYVTEGPLVSEEGEDKMANCVSIDIEFQLNGQSFDGATVEIGPVDNPSAMVEDILDTLFYNAKKFAIEHPGARVSMERFEGGTLE